MSQKPHLARRGCILWGLAALMILLLCGGAVFTVGARPELAAQAADSLRAIVGDEAVASLEMLAFQAQDVVQRAKYSLGLATPAAPWQADSPAVSPTITRASIPITSVTQLPSVSSPPEVSTTVSGVTGISSGKVADPPKSVLPTAAVEAVQPTSSATPEPAPTETTAPGPWTPGPVTPLGDLKGEGEWSPYLTDASGRTVAYRTFVEPDPNRPFVVVGVIAFDTENTRLHFVLGFQEPYSPDGPKRSGEMPEADKAPGRLLAMFNGGFKATHGHFGAMADGITALPPRDDLGTLTIYKDGRVAMGVWGSSIKPSEGMEAWRQNGPLVIQDGKINPRIYNNSPKDWGYTVTDVSPTWRSGVGISSDGRTLYYIVGPSLTMEALAKSMIAAGMVQGMQLDINNFWVHFVAVRDSSSGRALEPLFPSMMKDKIDRYLNAYPRDFFYVTTAP